MAKINRAFPRLSVALAALALSGAALAAAPETGVMAATESPSMVRSGGVSNSEFAELNRQASDYSLKLLLAAKGSGAWLADVKVAVRSLPEGEVMFEHVAQGPLLLASLPPGRYEVTGTFDDVRPGSPATQKRIIQVPRTGLAQAVLYFDTGDEVGADMARTATAQR